MREETENNRSLEILQLVNMHLSRGRTGDGYVRNLFYCALMSYVDKFGMDFFERIVEKMFVWAYTLRLKLHSVDIESVDNYALNWRNAKIPMFKIIRDACRPQDVLNAELEILTDVKATKEEDILETFKKLGYYAK